ncbi:outer membrane protein transport protein [Candidatus Accumulibacter sp. ACC003]|uniref:OmpP1/FadL family transporter n=1 Tax=Candidatus Accumulibacter sp. ACC003 TaxID=2823334 RepID=UPI0025C33D55|nr:outer membrane protein transport protein [Candidatus Accumulibacter sp. ACC003]
MSCPKRFEAARAATHGQATMPFRALVTLAAATLATTPAFAGGMIAYELGTADVGLASAGYNVRAQDASTVFTNPAGMTRLQGTQAVASGQLLWNSTRYSIDSGSSLDLGRNEGGYAVGSNGWFPGGGAFISHSVSPDLKVGFALAGNFGAPLKYDNDWAGRYYIQSTTLLGLSLVPSVAYKVNDKLSLGAGLNAMYGIYQDQVAINNPNPAFGDGRLKYDDNTWGWGANLGLLYEIDEGTRIGLTWNSQVNLDFKATPKFSGLSPLVASGLNKAGLLDSQLKIGITVPQQAMLSVFTQLDPQWAALGSVGWQQWSRFGRINIGIDNTSNPVSLTTAIPFKDTWHVAAGGQYRLSDPWLLNFGVAYDSGFQPDSSTVSPLMPLNTAWRFGVGGQQQLSKTSEWGVAAEYIYGGTLKTDLQTSAPVAVGGRGNLIGSYDNIGTIVMSVYGNWKF